MPKSRLSGPFSGPKVDVTIDMGNPFLNLTVDGFLKIGTVLLLLLFLHILTYYPDYFLIFCGWNGKSDISRFTMKKLGLIGWLISRFFSSQIAATRAAAEDAYYIVKKGISFFSIFIFWFGNFDIRIV